MIGETFTRLRAPADDVDRYGNPTLDWDSDDVDSLDLPGCSFAPGRGTEDRQDLREGQSITGTVYAPAGADVDALDRLVIRGDTYSVDGEPGAWTSPFSGASRGVEISVRRTEG